MLGILFRFLPTALGRAGTASPIAVAWADRVVDETGALIGYRLGPTAAAAGEGADRGF
jgi:hypothetical protein